MEFSFKLFEDLMESIERSYTISLLAKRLAESFHRSLSLEQLELVEKSNDRSHCNVIQIQTQETPFTVKESGRLFSNSALKLLCKTKKPWIYTAENCFFEEEKERERLACKGAVLIPLLKNQSVEGLIALYFREKEELFLQEPLLTHLTKLLSLAQHYSQLVEKLTKNSRDAYTNNRNLRQELSKHQGEIIARSPKMKEVLQKIELVAPHSTTILIRGESGTGKELVAQQIHQQSRRSHKPFIPINCGAIPESIIESELFGYEKGAFTGATHRHIGCFERAHEGTLFLDEIGDLPLSAQVKLLRVLQEGEAIRVGGEKSIKLNVIVITATHQDLEKLLTGGQFREDLYYRLNIFPITLPPLRERKEDLYDLTFSLLRKISTRLKRVIPEISLTVMQQIMDYSWPGNVRELANVLERSLILSQRGKFKLFLPLNHQTKELPPTVPPQIQTFEEASRDCIQKALNNSNGKIYGKGGAAEKLALKPGTLQSKMKKLNITRK